MVARGFLQKLLGSPAGTLVKSKVNGFSESVKATSGSKWNFKNRRGEWHHAVRKGNIRTGTPVEWVERQIEHRDGVSGAREYMYQRTWTSKMAHGLERPILAEKHLIFMVRGPCAKYHRTTAHFVGSGRFQALSPPREHMLHAPDVRSDIRSRP